MYTWHSTEMNAHRIAMIQELSKARRELAEQEKKVDESAPAPEAKEKPGHGPPAMVELSPWALEAADAKDGIGGTEEDRSESGHHPRTPWELDHEEKQDVEKLRMTDAKVRAHEMAHAGSGAMTSAPSYDFVTGPDGKRYAVGGHVDVDTSEGSTPEGTVAKARQIRAAALAPVDPSPQDRAVAAQASQMEAAAMAELAERGRVELSKALEGVGDGEEGEGGGASGDGEGPEGAQVPADPVAQKSAFEKFVS
jgi:hypothetical protein